MPQNSLRVAPLFLTLLLLIPVSLHAQVRSDYFDEPGEIILPPDYDEELVYPLLVMLPYTGGTAVEQARAFGIEPGEQEDVVLLLPKGRFHSRDYLPDFLSFVSWFEDRLYEDISAAVDRYSISDEAIYLAGYSLGGDLSWALSVRNPSDFAGAIVAGSRSSHPVNESGLDTLSDEDFRAAFLIGNNDSPNRYQGLNYARSRFEAVDIPVMYREYDGGHELPPQELSIEALEFISESDERVIRASGSSWPNSPRKTSDAGDRGDGLLSGLFGSGVTTNRLRLETDLPVAVSSRYQSGVGYSGIDSAGLVFETLFDSGWVSGDLEIVSGVTTTASNSRRASSGVSAAFGDRIALGAGISWDWTRWVSESAMLHDLGNTASGEIYRRPRISAIAVLRGDRSYTPRATGRISYEIPSFVDPFVLTHVANMDFEFEAWAAERLLVDGGVATGTRQRRPVDERSAQADYLDSFASWNLGVGFAVNEEVTISLSGRGAWLEDIAGHGDGTLTGYNQELRLVLRYSLL